MRIAFDAKRMLQNATGLGNYSRYMVNALVNHFPDNQYLLFSPREGRLHLRELISKSPRIQYIYPDSFISKRLPSLWRTYQIPEDNYDIDIFHGLSNELPLNIKGKRCRSVVTIHDLIYERFPKLYSPIDRMLYQYKYKRACQNADHIVAVSEQTKKDIISFYKIPDHKISVVYQGCDPIFSVQQGPEDITSVLDKYHINQPYVLYVGSIEERKNLVTLAKSIKKASQDLTFVAIGKPTSYTTVVKNYIQEHQLDNRIKILHNISYQELPVFYQGARMFVYPSVFEGFGIPVIEALSSGIPVIGAKGSCLEEAGGKDSLYIEPFNSDQLTDYINQIHKSDALRQQMITTGYAHVNQFEAKSISQSMMQVYRNTIQR